MSCYVVWCKKCSEKILSTSSLPDGVDFNHKTFPDQLKVDFGSASADVIYTGLKSDGFSAISEEKKDYKLICKGCGTHIANRVVHESGNAILSSRIKFKDPGSNIVLERLVSNGSRRRNGSRPCGGK